MTNSIWDTRFNSGRRGVALDADDEGQWITIRGARVLVDGDGKVIGGAEGKFNGSNYKEERVKAQEKKVPTGTKKVGNEEFQKWFIANTKESFKRDAPEKLSDDRLNSQIEGIAEMIDRYSKEGYDKEVIGLLQHRLGDLGMELMGRDLENGVKKMSQYMHLLH